jgi:hypothetical protein
MFFRHKCPSPNAADAETVALLAPAQGRRPGRSRDRGRCQFGAARTPGRDARLGTIGDVPRLNRSDAEKAALLSQMQGRRPGRSRAGPVVGAARMPGRDALVGTMSDGTVAPTRSSALARRPGGRLDAAQ